MAVPLATVKEHLRLDGDHEDATLAVYLAAAEGHIASVGVDMGADPLPAPLTAAVLLLTGHLYEHREAAMLGVDAFIMPLGVDRLIAPYREATA